MTSAVTASTKTVAARSSYESRNFLIRLKNVLFGTAISLTLFLSYFYVTDTRSSIHLLTPKILRYLYDDAEEAHEVGNRSLRWLYAFGLHPRERQEPRRRHDGSDEENDLSITIFGEVLDSPLGTSAGIDKKAEIPDALFAMGASIVEVGGATPLPQEGNPKPRVWRLPSQNGLVNRYGLNSHGAEAMAAVLRRRIRLYAAQQGLGASEDAEQAILDGEAGVAVPPGSLTKGKLLAVQIAKNKSTPDNDIDAVTADYVSCVQSLGLYADILVVNVSSPNTPGLRGLQAVEPLTKILSGVVAAAKAVNRKVVPRVMVKVSPDEDSDRQVRGICKAAWQSGVSGIIVGNTTTSRPSPNPSGHILSPREAAVWAEKGGYSGPQLYDRTVSLVSRYRQLLDEGIPYEDTKAERMVIIATGGITNGQEALGVLEAGASCAQMYTALVYGGAGTVTRVKKELRQEMKERYAHTGMS